MSKIISNGFIDEENNFPKIVKPVETSLPIFIGYTQMAIKDGKSLLLKPTKIVSLTEYENYFGKGFHAKFTIEEAQANYNEEIFVLNGSNKQVKIKANNKFILHSCINLFYKNKGAYCYIMSVGTYADKPNGMAIDATDFTGNESKQNVFTILEKEEVTPTLIAMPDVINMGIEAYPIYKMALAHCAKMKNRFAILDVWQTNRANLNIDIQNFRDGTGNIGLSYAAAYYPWLKTTIVQEAEVDFTNLDKQVNLADFLPEQAAKNIANKIKTLTEEQIITERINLHQQLKVSSSNYQIILDAIRVSLNLLPASAAIAGVYNVIDKTRGVWKAPANVPLAAVIATSIDLSYNNCERLNSGEMSGKSICPIKNITNYGTLVYGARTLDGLDFEWKYIPVKRTVMMIEQSIKIALANFIFEPNEIKTWSSIKQMVENFLFYLWRNRCLTGMKPEDGFFINIGLGSTMTDIDILENNLCLLIGVAIVKPVEFITIQFKQKQINA